jgi:hypothetical protein
MVKVVIIIPMLFLLCCDKEPQVKQVVEVKSAKMAASEDSVKMMNRKTAEEKRLTIWLLLSLEEKIIEYEKKFNREPPGWANEIHRILGPLIRAIEIDMPFPTAAEIKTIENTAELVKAEYKKKFMESITDFELSVERVYFRTGNTEHRYLSVIRTAAGALAIYEDIAGPNKEQLKLELDMGEWLDFIRALYKCRIDEWKIFYDNPTALDGEQWRLQIFFLNRLERERFTSGGSNRYPQNWEKFEKIMKGKKKKIKKGGTLSTTAK